jgi:hypothetical protein
MICGLVTWIPAIVPEACLRHDGNDVGGRLIGQYLRSRVLVMPFFDWDDDPKHHRPRITLMGIIIIVLTLAMVGALMVYTLSGPRRRSGDRHAHLAGVMVRIMAGAGAVGVRSRPISAATQFARLM